MAIGLGQMLIGGLLGNEIGKNGGISGLLGGLTGDNKGRVTDEEMATHQMPDGTTMPGATHPEGGYNQAPQQQAQAPQQQSGGFMSGINNLSQSQLAKLGMGFNSMRMHPDANLAASFQKTIDTSVSNKTKNLTVKQLRKMGHTNIADLVESGVMSVKDASAALSKNMGNPGDAKGYVEWLKGEAQKPGQEHFAQYAEMLGFNPTDSMMKDITTMVTNDLGMGDANTKITFSTPKVNQETGAEYVVRTDPNAEPDKQITIVNTGNTLPTTLEIAAADSQAKILAADKAKAVTTGAQAFQDAQALEGDIYDYTIALDNLTVTDPLTGVKTFTDEKARTGWIANKLPAMKKETSALRRIANIMGIKVINMATFGALSEREMAMAMATNLDLQLPGQELVPFIEEMIEAKRKFANVLYQRTYDLTSNPEMTYTQWQLDTTEKALEHDKYRYYNLSDAQKAQLEGLVEARGLPEGYTGQMIWNSFNLETRKGF